MLDFTRVESVHVDVESIHRKEMTMTTLHKIPDSRNLDWGFFGTLKEHAPAAWPIAMATISDATGQPLESARAFLDSRHGRHFADDVQSRMFMGRPLNEAIDDAVTLWMTWTISLPTSKQFGIPRGMPHLIGFVIHCEIVEEELAA
jgi:hypothetical protein